jgi:hypothetical protein
MDLPFAPHRLGALLGIVAQLVSLSAEAGIGRTRGNVGLSKKYRWPTAGYVDSQYWLIFGRLSGVTP